MAKKSSTVMGIVSVGNPYDGLTLYGPFPIADAAVWAEKNIGTKDEWHVARVYSEIVTESLETFSKG